MGSGRAWGRTGSRLIAGKCNLVANTHAHTHTQFELQLHKLLGTPTGEEDPDDTLDPTLEEVPLIEEGGGEGEKDKEEEPPSKGKEKAGGLVVPGHKTAPHAPFTLGEGLPVVPAKIVTKIQKGEYVDMAELLKDNIEVGRRRVEQGGAGGIAAAVCSWIGGRAGRREVPDVTSWAQCFCSYAAVFGEKYPHKTRELWAYMALIMREARRCGGNGWRDYDSMFRQQAASAVDLEWGKLNSSLYAVTFLAQQVAGRGPRVCRHCQEADHPSSECALQLGQEPRSGYGYAERSSTRADSRPSSRARGDKICHSWNTGRCRFEPYCKFRHVCSTLGCNEDHKAIDCARGKGRGQNGAEQRK